VDLIGWIGVGLGGNCDCRCGILYAPMLGVVFYVGLVSLISSSYPCSPYSSELISDLGIFYKISFSRKLSEPEDSLYRPKHVIFSIANKHHHLAIFCSCVLTEFTSPYSLYTQR